MPFSENVANREVGEFALSIATDLAMQSAFGVHPEIKATSPPILKFDEMWINIRTLFRNLLGAMDSAGKKGVLPPTIANAMAAEMEMITSLVRDHTSNRVKVIYYISDYDGIERKYSSVGVVRKDSTPKQLEYTAIGNETFKILLTQYKDLNIQTYTLKIAPKEHGSPKIMILTNYAFDLLSHKSFGHMALLESHTGAIKERAQWPTKYLNGKELTQIPFTEYFLIIFGDSETFRPWDMKVRKELIDLAAKYNWTAVTTSDKIRYGVNSIKNPYAKELILNAMKFG